MIGTLYNIGVAKMAIRKRQLKNILVNILDDTELREVSF